MSKRLCDCGGYGGVLPWTHQEYLSAHCMGVEAGRALQKELLETRDRLMADQQWDAVQQKARAAVDKMDAIEKAQNVAKSGETNVVAFGRDSIGGKG
tara:strand:+ start:332 stop:622 length:291 start_codon:yes stop_codon:yes gene_type:complete